MWQNVEKFKGVEYFCKALYTWLNAVPVSQNTCFPFRFVTSILISSIDSGIKTWRLDLMSSTQEIAYHGGAGYVSSVLRGRISEQCFIWNVLIFIYGRDRLLWMTPNS